MPSVRDLDVASFRVLENDEPQAIDLATGETLPVTYTLLVDASQSMHTRMGFVRKAAGRLADFLRPDDRVIVAPFNQSLGAITGPTADSDTIAGAVEAIASKGGTAIADVLVKGARLMSGAERRHVVVLITDGYDGPKGPHSGAAVRHPCSAGADPCGSNLISWLLISPPVDRPSADLPRPWGGK